MRRLLALLSVLAVSQAALAISESGPREEGPRRAEGRAVIVTPAHALSAADRAELAAKGLTVKHALGGGRYLARAQDTADLTGDARVVAIEPLTAERKIDFAARREAGSGRTLANVHVIFHRDITFPDALQAVLTAGGAVEPFTFRFLPAQRIDAKIAPSALSALAADERVFAIAGPRNFKIANDNATSAALSHVTEVQAAPYGLSGLGITVSLFELGAAQATHVEFGGRLTLASSTAGGSSGDRRHGTHVAGTIGASGVRADAKGMAPAATIHQFCVPTGGNQCTGDWLELKEDRLAPLGVLADNNSWGYILGWQSGDVPLWNGADRYYGAYDLIVGSPVDKISNEQGILFVNSTGNDGNLPSALANDPWKGHHHVDEFGEEIGNQTFCVSQNGSGTDCPPGCNGAGTPCEIGLHGAATPFDTIGVTAAAKNNVAVGAVDGNGQIISFSSRGPAKDGRVKPDVVARGTALSSVPTDAYQTLQGTSMAAPVVTGIAALIGEQWKRTFAGAKPTPAQIKTLLIAGARDLGNPGPDYTYGFGLADAKNSVDLILADAARGDRIRNLTFAEGQAVTQHEIPLVVTEQTNLRVVLDWPDPPIAMPIGGDDDIAPVALVNNLDVKVLDPAGNTHFAWVLDKNQVNANATRGANTVDNVEMVEIANAAPGIYRVVATGTKVDEGPQSAVLVANARFARPCVDIQETSNNNTPESAYGNINSGSKIYGGLCSSSDVDFYKFLASREGPVSVTITTGDTPLRATLTGTGISRTQNIDANSTAVLNADSNVAPNTVTLKIEPQGALGAEPQYSFTPTFGVKVPPKRRTVRP